MASDINYEFKEYPKVSAMRVLTVSVNCGVIFPPGTLVELTGERSKGTVTIHLRSAGQDYQCTTSPIKLRKLNKKEQKLFLMLFDWGI